MIKYQSFNPHPEFCIYTKHLIVNLILINSNFNFNYTWQFEYGCPFNFVLIPFYCLSTSNSFIFLRNWEKKNYNSPLYRKFKFFFMALLNATKWTFHLNRISFANFSLLLYIRFEIYAEYIDAITPLQNSA